MQEGVNPIVIDEEIEKNNSETEIDSRECYNFKELEAIEPAMISLISQMKEKIQNGNYDTLISDEAGGRIPTLIIRKVIKTLHPELELKTFFVSAGHSTPYDQTERYENLREYLVQNIIKDEQKALIITQFLFTGKSLYRFISILKEAGLNNFDLAAMNAYVNHIESVLDELKQLLPQGNKFYYGTNSWNTLNEEHEKFGGVRKSTQHYLPHPERAVDIINREGRQISDEDWKKIFGISDRMTLKEKQDNLDNPVGIAEYERQVHKPLTEEEEKQIQQNINLARKDVDLLVKRIINKIWNS